MGEQESLFPVGPIPKTPREYPQDPLWDALDEEFGKVRTKSERGRRNSVVKELRDADVTPEEIRITVSFCRKNFTHFTEGAVCNWLSRALHEETSRGADVHSIFERMRESAK